MCAPRHRPRPQRAGPEDGGTCRHIVEHDGQCYAGPPGLPEPAPVACDTPLDVAYADFPSLPTQSSCEPRPRDACVTSGDCPRGLACAQGRCEGCQTNCSQAADGTVFCSGAGGPCADGETCVGTTCVLDANVTCTSFTDCPEEQRCLLSGIGPAGRGNETTRSFCGYVDSTPEPSGALEPLLTYEAEPAP